MFLYIILYRDDSLELNKLGNKLPETVRNYLFKTLFCLLKRSLRVALFLVGVEMLKKTTKHCNIINYFEYR